MIGTFEEPRLSVLMGEAMAEEFDYVIVGRPFTKQRVNGKKRRVPKKVHLKLDGKTLCQTENGYKHSPKYEVVNDPAVDAICKLCLGLS